MRLGTLSFTPLPPPPRRSTASAAGGGGGGGGAKQTHRLLSSLAASPSPFATSRLLSSCSKSTALHTLSHLLSLSSPLALPLYHSLTETPWFKPSPKLTAAVIALQTLHHPHSAQSLLSTTTAHLTSPRALTSFHCDLIDALSAHSLSAPALETFHRIRSLPFSGRRPYEAIIKGLSQMGFLSEAEAMLDEMAAAGFQPSAFEVRTIIHGYGKKQSFEDMRRLLGRVVVDTVCANIVLSCFGECGEVGEMVAWVREMKGMGVRVSVRTFNTVLNSCATVVSMMGDLKTLPLSVDDFVRKVEEESPIQDEVLLVSEMVGYQVFDEMLEWSASEGKLDLHGCHTASAYLVLLQWMRELRMRFLAGEVVPMEISIVCGTGKHSRKVAVSPIKQMVSEMMFRLESPMKMDRKNVGRFVAKGKMVSKWLCDRTDLVNWRFQSC